MISFYIDSLSRTSRNRLNALLLAADPLTAQQKHNIYHKVPELLTALTSIMVRAIEEGHKSENIDAQKFWNDLFLHNKCEGYIDNHKYQHTNQSLMSPDRKAKLGPSSAPIQDPYAKLDFQACMKYLYFNGGRLREVNGKLEQFKDHESFYRFFGLSKLEYVCGWDREKKCDRDTSVNLRCGDFSWALAQLTSQRNVLMHNSEENRDSVTLQEYVATLLDLYALLTPLCNTAWYKQAEAIELYKWLDVDFYHAAGNIMYPISALMSHSGIPAHQQATMESLLTDANVPIDGGKVTLRVNPERFALAMHYAWMHASYNWDRAVAVLQESASVPHKQQTNEQQPNVFIRRTHMRSISLNELQRMANKDVVKAQIELGCRYWLGTGDAEQNYAQAFNYFTKAAQTDPGNGDAQFYLGQCWETGHCPGNIAMPSKAISHFRKAARAGHVQALIHMGRHYEAQEHYDQAFAMYEQAAQSSDPHALYYLGRYYEQGLHCELNLDEALLFYREAAEGGLQEAKLALALCLPLEANGTRSKEATGLLEELAENGCVEAMCVLGHDCEELVFLTTPDDPSAWDDPVLLERVEKYRHEAENWFRRAIKTDDPKAWLEWGHYLFQQADDRGARGLDDWQEVLNCYRTAAEKGVAEGYYHMGRVHCHVYGAHKLPPREALDYFRKAANMGHARSMYEIALATMNQGVENEGDEPFFYLLSDAAKLGYKRANLLVDVFTSPCDQLTDWSGMIQALKQREEKDAAELYTLAYCYLQRAAYSRSPDSDIASAAAWLEQAANHGSKLAMCALYEQTVESDPETARYWLEKAVDSESYLAMRLMYEATCDSDPAGAKAWLEKAQAVGDTGSYIALDYLAKGDEACFYWKQEDCYYDVTDEERAIRAEIESPED